MALIDNRVLALETQQKFGTGIEASGLNPTIGIMLTKAKTASKRQTPACKRFTFVVPLELGLIMETTLNNPSTSENRHGKNRNIVPAAIVAFGLITGALILKGNALPSWRSFVTWPIGLQFASQVKAGLRARNPKGFQRLTIKSVSYNPIRDSYHIWSGTFWDIGIPDYSSELWQECNFHKKDGAYSGACYGVPIRIR